MTEASQSYSDGELVVRDIEFDWENVLPLSRSDKVIDASTLRDRSAISLHTYLEEAGFRDPGKEIKKIKKEVKDKELMAALPKFQQFAPGTVRAQLDAQKLQMQAQEDQAEMIGMSQPQPKPQLQHQSYIVIKTMVGVASSLDLAHPQAKPLQLKEQ